MLIPKSIQLGGHTIKVVFKPLRDDHGLFLICDNEYYIYLDEGERGSVISEETFFHELLEAVDSIYEMNWKHEQIQKLGVFLHQALGPVIGVEGDLDLSSLFHTRDRSEALLSDLGILFSAPFPPEE